MTFLIAAAGTGGHVFPGLSVGEALVDLGVSQEELLYVGGDRLEARVYPAKGYRFVQVELAGLKRSLSLDNARLPRVVLRARRLIADEIAASGVEVVLGMGGYVTIPAALAARRRRVAFFNSEQNAEAGLANRLTARWARASFVAFPDTGGLPQGKWVGNPVRREFWEFDRETLRSEALGRYELSAEMPVIGVFGGSLGAGLINDAVAEMLEEWSGPEVQVIHLTGPEHHSRLERRSAAHQVSWRRRGFEERMDLFLSVCDVVISRAGGAVAELTATGTPSILVPGRFGSGGHQAANARFLKEAGAALVVREEELDHLPDTVMDLLTNSEKLATMAASTRAIAKPEAARTIAGMMIEASGRRAST
jgi:UDP-N-acetylglucosamine--N-acetylmuramyl-(pentapeptide) pyrophosphoryl-undecaprenol N-acetylglucosamine transferase